MHRILMGPSSPNSAQIKIGKIFLNRLENGEENSFTTKELEEILQNDGLNYSTKNIIRILHTYFSGVIDGSYKTNKWTLAEDVTVDDLRQIVEILEKSSSNRRERL